MKNILVMVLALIMLGGCTFESTLVETSYDFPVIKEDINKIIKEEGLPWSVGEEIDTLEGLGYYIKNGNGKNTVKVSSVENGDSRQVRLDLLSPDNNEKGNIERLDAESIEKMFTMVARIYGLGALSESQKVYGDVIGYMKDRSAKEFGATVFESKYGDYYFSVALDIKEDNYSISYIKIENKSSYETSMKLEADRWKESLGSKLPVVDNASIIKLKNAPREEVLILEGSVIKQSRLSKEKAKLLKSVDYNGNKRDISRYDYVDANIVSGDQQISVILRINGLGEDEIGENRTYYVYYSPENTVGVVEYMVK